MRVLVLVLATLSALVAATPAVAADGDLEPNYGTDAEFPGFGFYANPNGNPTFTLDTADALLPRPDGKMWLVGRMRGPSSVYRISLYRIGANGYPDTDFGDLGLRTVVGPCDDFHIGDAALDSQGRILVATQNCTDFKVYRFLDDGDLDFSFGGTGVVSIAFDLGASNEDHAQKIVVTEDDGFVVAGVADAVGGDHLALARYTAAGEPVAEFGTGGKLDIGFEWQVSPVSGLGGLHRMDDGRIVATGQISESDQAVSDKKQFVVRLLAQGAFDPSFGNVSPGISKVNLKSPLGLARSPWVSRSLLERDGSVIQVGSLLSNDPISSNDIFLLRWRADGQLDTSIGAHGVRSYALDFAGANPPQPNSNSDMADAIVRQGDGKYVILATGYAGDFYATTVMRLRRDLSLDTAFGDGGAVQHLAMVATNGDHGTLAGSALVLPGRIIAAGTSFTGINGRIQTTFAMSNDLLFADGFE